MLTLYNIEVGKLYRHEEKGIIIAVTKLIKSKYPGENSHFILKYFELQNPDRELEMSFFYELWGWNKII